jgi:hypothetical protein
MWNGCGDGSDLASYSCFCTDSYSKFRWDISTSVSKNCRSLPTQVAIAVGVFEEYCASGTTQLGLVTAQSTGEGQTSSEINLGLISSASEYPVEMLTPLDAPATSTPFQAPLPTQARATSGAITKPALESVTILQSYC